jgi:hypothetical protein
MDDKMKTIACLPAILDAVDNPPESLLAAATSKPSSVLMTQFAVNYEPATGHSEALFNHRLLDFVESDVPRYNDATFQAHFRMNRATFQMDDLIYMY